MFILILKKILALLYLFKRQYRLIQYEQKL